MIKKRKIKRVSDKVNYFIALPKNLSEEIDSLGLTKERTIQAKRIVDIIITKSLYKYDDGMVTHEIPLSGSYLVNVISSSYKKVVDALLECGIITRSNFYSVKHGICYKYRLAKEMVGKGEVKISGVSMVRKEKQEESESVFLSLFKKDLSQLNINTLKLREEALKRIKTISLESFKVNEQIDEKGLRLKNKNKIYNYSKSKALEHAKKDGLDVVQDGSFIIFTNANEYVDMKRNSMKFYYESIIIKLEKSLYYASRNSTNFRLDTNITNMPSFMVDIIKKDNGLIEVDMHNAQMTFLANKMSNVETMDSKLFKELCEEGRVYEYIKDKLGLKQREDAKRLTFEVVFSSETNNSKDVMRFYKLFPSVKEFVNNIKNEIGHKKFAVELQKIESELFIDGFYKKLKDNRVFCLTKHDSLIVKKEDLDEVINLCCGIMDARGFKCSLNY